MANEIKDIVNWDQVLAAPEDLEGRSEILGLAVKLDGLSLDSGTSTWDKFTLYDGKHAAEVDVAAETLHHILRETLTPGLFADCGLAKDRRNRKAANFRERISGSGNNRLRAVAAIGYHSGSIQDKGNIQVIDACGGNGVLGIGISALRTLSEEADKELPKELIEAILEKPGELKALVDPAKHLDNSRTHAICVDIDPAKTRRHEVLRRSLGLDNPNLRLQIGDFRNFTPETDPDRNTYILGKHTCGTSTDTSLARILSWPQGSFPKAALLTCCHTKADKYPYKKGDRNIIVTPEEWATLTKVTNWVDGRFTHQGGPALTPEHRLIGRTAMKILDLQRVLALPEEVRGEVRELLPPEILSRNHGILITKRS